MCIPCRVALSGSAVAAPPEIYTWRGAEAVQHRLAAPRAVRRTPSTDAPTDGAGEPPSRRLGYRTADGGEDRPVARPR